MTNAKVGAKTEKQEDSSLGMLAFSSGNDRGEGVIRHSDLLSH